MQRVTVENMYGNKETWLNMALFFNLCIALSIKQNQKLLTLLQTLIFLLDTVFLQSFLAQRRDNLFRPKSGK